MKRLTLVRHGKSSWKHDLPDDERPLKKRAYRDGDLVSMTYKEFYSGDAMLWSSPAVRALETAKIFKNQLEVPDKNFKIKESLYTFDQDDLLNIITSCDDSLEKLVVFGHNPAMTGLVNRLGDKSLDNLPTTGLCVIEFEVDSWKDIKRGKTLLTLIPKELR